MKLWINSIISDNSERVAGRVFTALMSVLILINVAFILIDTLDSGPSQLKSISHFVEVFSVTVFSAEYLLRIWTADLLFPDLNPWRARLRYFASGMAVIDLLSILPFYLSFISIDLRILRVLRLVRVIRVFKLGHYNTAMSKIGRVLKKSIPALVSSMSVLFLMLIVSSVLIFYAESAQPDTPFTSAFSGLWWAISAVTTVGYGDIVPLTIAGKILGAIIALLGIALIAIPTGIFSAGFMSEMERETTEPTNDFNPDLAEQLTKLKQLLDQSILTKEEFDAEKRRILQS